MVFVDIIICDLIPQCILQPVYHHHHHHVRTGRVVETRVRKEIRDTSQIGGDVLWENTAVVIHFIPLCCRPFYYYHNGNELHQ